VDGDPGEGRQDPGSVHSDPATPLVQAVVGQVLGGGHVNPAELADHPGSGLIEVGQRSGRDLRGDLIGERCQQPPGPPRQRGQVPAGDRYREHIAEQLAGPCHRQVLAGQQVGTQRGHARPVTRRRGRHRGEGRRGQGRARGAGAALSAVLADPYPDRRQVEDLTHHPSGDRGAGQIAAAAAAASRDVLDDLIGDRHRLQTHPRIALALPRAPTRAGPQRTRRRLAQPVRTRRLGRVTRVLPQPGLQLANPFEQKPIGLHRLSQHLLKPSNPLPRIPERRHPTSITSHTRNMPQARRPPE
jgi:hypothetical protein